MMSETRRDKSCWVFILAPVRFTALSTTWSRGCSRSQEQFGVTQQAEWLTTADLWWLPPKRVLRAAAGERESKTAGKRCSGRRLCVFNVSASFWHFKSNFERFRHSEVFNVSTVSEWSFHAGKDGTAPSSVSMSEVCRVYKPLNMWGDSELFPLTPSLRYRASLILGLWIVAAFIDFKEPRCVCGSEVI